MTSNDIINELLTSLESYVTANFSDSVVEYESEIRPDSEMQQLVFQEFSIGIDESNATVTQLVSSYNATKTNQAYEIRIFYRISRELDNPVNVSSRIRDMKDTIVGWLLASDFSTITTQKLMYLQYVNNSSVNRNENYATQSINLVSYRTLS